MKFYVNKNKDIDGDNEVHTSDCSWLPKAENREYLGIFTTCEPAVVKAKQQGYHATMAVIIVVLNAILANSSKKELIFYDRLFFYIIF